MILGVGGAAAVVVAVVAIVVLAVVVVVAVDVNCALLPSQKNNSARAVRCQVSFLPRKPAINSTTRNYAYPQVGL